MMDAKSQTMAITMIEAYFPFEKSILNTQYL